MPIRSRSSVKASVSSSRRMVPASRSASGGTSMVSWPRSTACARMRLPSAAVSAACRLSRVRAKDDAEAVEVVARGPGMHHLDRAAGEAEGHGPERAGPRPVEHVVDLRDDEALLGNAAFSHLSLPFERPLLPLVDEADDEDTEEHDHRDQAEPADVLEHDRPGKEEGDLEIEEDEEDGDQVVAHVELHARVLERLETAFVGGELLAVRILRPRDPSQDSARDDAANADRGTDGEEEQDRKVALEQCRDPALFEMVPSKRLELLRLSALPPQDSVSTNSTTTATYRFAFKQVPAYFGISVDFSAG